MKDEASPKAIRTFGLLYILFILTSPVRLLGEEIYIGISILFTLSIILIYKSKEISKIYIVLFLFTLLYLALSYLSVFDDNKHPFMHEAILRQFMPLFFLLITLPSFRAICLEILSSPPHWRTALVGIIVIVVVSIVFRSPENIISGGKIYGTLSPALLLQFLLIYLAIILVDNRYITIGILIGTLAFVGATTNILIQLLAISIFLIGYANLQIRVLNIALILIFITTLALPDSALSYITSIDPNGAVRIALWQSTVFELISSSPFGHGFGTTWVNENFVNTPGFSNIFNSKQKLFTVANHNSFIDLVSRLGLIGLALFCVFLATIFPKLPTQIHKKRPVFCVKTKANTKMDAIVFGMIMLTMFFNPALQSVRSVGFISLAIGYLLASKAKHSK